MNDELIIRFNEDDEYFYISITEDYDADIDFKSLYIFPVDKSNWKYLKTKNASSIKKILDKASCDVDELTLEAADYYSNKYVNDMINASKLENIINNKTRYY